MRENDRWKNLPKLTEVAEYDGQPAVMIRATQHGSEVTARRAREIVEEWMQFFVAGPSPIVDLEFISRTPKRLFGALHAQTQLQRLTTKWGDFQDLSTLAEMQDLRTLSLGGAASVVSVDPLRELTQLQSFAIDSASKVRDWSALGELRNLRSLSVGSGINSPRPHAIDVEFLRKLPFLEHLFFAPIVDSMDYSPFLALGSVERISLVKARGMQPSFADLEWALPGLQGTVAESAARVIPVTNMTTGEHIGDYKTDIDGRIRLHPPGE